MNLNAFFLSFFTYCRIRANIEAVNHRIWLTIENYNDLKMDDVIEAYEDQQVEVQ